MIRPKRAVFTGACIILAGVAAAAVLWPNWFTGSQGAIVVYCAHDSVFADAVLKEFEQKTGIPVNVVYDSEATKSLGLVNQLKFEKDDPHCDVFWNNELLGTMDLASEGVLEPYKGDGYKRIPPQYKDEEGRWTGFAARMRVWIWNTKEAPRSKFFPTPEVLFKKHISRAAIAKPLYGTTLTHYSLLWQLWGADRLKKWDADVRRNGLRILAGNARVKDAVAEGVCEIGWTDTDDCFEAIDDHKPVELLPLIVADPAPEASAEAGKAAPAGSTPAKGSSQQFTIIIPNTVSLVRGTKKRAEAERFIDFVLSAETELTLAKSKSRQVPLGPVDLNQLPPEVRKLSGWVSQGYDLRKLEGARRECLAWLKSEPQ